MQKDWFIPVFFSCSSQRLGLEATVRVQRERAEAGAVCDCVENTEANREMPLNASEQDSPGSFLLTRPDRVSGLASYKTSKVGREPQGEIN